MYHKRWRALEREMEKRRARAFVVSNPNNIRYLCCTHLYTAAPPTFLVLTRKDGPIAITSWLESNRTRSECEVDEVRIWGNLPGKKADAKKGYLALKKVLGELAAGNVLVDRKVEGLRGVRMKSSDAIEKMRAVKDESELGRIRKAAAIADAGARELPELLRYGGSELAVANELDYFLRSRGCQGLAFQTIIAAGKHSAYPHHDNEGTTVKDSMVICDFGVYVDGYCSDITRTFLVGRAHVRLREAYDAVAEAIKAGTARVRPERPIREVDLACREVLRTRGLGGYFVHSTGHGIGLEVHEAPTAGPRSKDVMKKGMVFTVEPGVYIPGLGGIRIENDVLVTGSGAEVLTRSHY
jgi:Xaa-Pro aminopeptidase